MPRTDQYRMGKNIHGDVLDVRAIKWGDPPKSKNRHGVIVAFVEELKKRPGEWAKVPHIYNQASITSTYRAKYSGTDWTARKRDDGAGYDVYGCWTATTRRTGPR